MVQSKIVRIFPRPGGASGARTEARGSDPGDRDLMARVARGDTAAHRMLFDRFYARVTAFVRRRLRDEGLCEEVVSDVFFEVWRNAQTFRGESEVHSWIFGIAHFKALSAGRRQGQLKRAAVVPTDDGVLSRFAAEGDVTERLESRQEVRRLLRAIEQLPSGHRDVLRLAFLEGYSYQEIAAELNITEGNVKTRVNRARIRLRALISRNETETDPS